MVLSLLISVGIASREYANYLVGFPVTVTDNQDPNGGTETEKNISFFLVRVIWIWDHPCILIKESRPCFLKGDAMLLLVSAVLPFVPFEDKFRH